MPRPRTRSSSRVPGRRLATYSGDAKPRTWPKLTPFPMGKNLRHLCSSTSAVSKPSTKWTTTIGPSPSSLTLGKNSFGARQR
eukprot:6227438-Heterocapsa_arctica.AAC.1